MKRTTFLLRFTVMAVIIGRAASGAGAQPVYMHAFAGGGPSYGEGVPATQAQLAAPQGIAFDADGNIYFADSDNFVVRRVDAVSGIITTFAGNGSFGYSGDGGPAAAASLSVPFGVAVDSEGNVYIADVANSRIRRVRAVDGIIQTVAGNGFFGFSGDGGPATGASLTFPEGVAVDSVGRIYIADVSNWRVRRVSNGIITTIAGNGNGGFSGDGGPATDASFGSPRKVAVDAAANVYILDQDATVTRVRRVDAQTGIIQTFAGGGNGTGESGPATGTDLGAATDIAVFGDDLYIAGQYRVWRVSLTDNTIRVHAGTGVAGNSGNGSPALDATFTHIGGVGVTANGEVYISDAMANRVRRARRPLPGIIYAFAGGGTSYGEGVRPTQAQLSSPLGIALNTSGDVFISDSDNAVVRRVDCATGLITTFAGNGFFGFSGDGGPAILASLILPSGISLDPGGNVYFSDSFNDRVRWVHAATGIINTIAGNGQVGYQGDGVPAWATSLFTPEGVAVDTSGNIFIADVANYRVRRVSAATSLISTVAGTGLGGYSGDGGPATSANLYDPRRIAVDAAGHLYIFANLAGEARVRKVDANTGIITRFAGGGSGSGESGPAIDMHIPVCADLAVHGDMLYVASLERVWKVSLLDGTVSVFAGTGAPGGTGDGGPATAATFAFISGVGVGSDGTVYISDGAANRVRLVGSNPPPVINQQPQSQTTCPGDTVSLQTDATGAPPITFVWRRNGAPLANGPTPHGSIIGGAQTNTLSIQNVAVEDFASYTVMVIDANGSRISDPASISEAGILVTEATTQQYLDSLTTIDGSLLMIDEDNRPTLIVPNLTSPACGVRVADNAALTTVQAPLLATVGRNVRVQNNPLLNDLALPGLIVVDGDVEVSGNPLLDLIALPSLGVAAGNVMISGNSAAETIDLGGLVGVGEDLTVTGFAVLLMDTLYIAGGDVTLEAGGDVDLAGAAIGGNIDISTVDASSIDIAAPGGTIAIKMSNDGASVDADIADNAVPADTAIGVVRLDPGTLGPVDGLDPLGAPISLDPIAAYDFGIGGALSAPASLVFELTLADLAPADQTAVLDAYVAGQLTMSVQGDAPGSVPQARAVCAPNDPLVPDGCVRVNAFNAQGAQLPPGVITGAVRLRVASEVSHFSTYSVAIVLGAPIMAGNCNCDDAITAEDIDAFVLMICDAVEYAKQYPGCTERSGDMNGDRKTDGLDIRLFVEALLGAKR